MYSLRPFSEEDLPKMLEIERRVHKGPWNATMFRAEWEKPYCRIWVLTDDETDEILVGYVVFWRMYEEGQILNIAVDLPFQRQGHARKIVRKVAATCMSEGAKRLVLEVRKSNAGAIGLYQSTGFTVSKIRKNYYSDGEDAFEMALELDGELAEQLRSF